MFFFRTKASVLVLLAAICLVKGGHELIVAAFDRFKKVSVYVLRVYRKLTSFISFLGIFGNS